MSEGGARYEISPEGTARITAVDTYLEETIHDGDPLEALMAIKWLGEMVGDRSKEAARVATEGPSSWSDVGKALGMTKQAAHEKLRARVHGKIAEGLSRLDEAEEAGHAKIARRAKRGRDSLAQVPPFSPKIESAGRRIDEWEQRQHGKLNRDVRKARDEVARAERSAQEKLDRMLPDDKH